MLLLLFFWESNFKQKLFTKDKNEKFTLIFNEIKVSVLFYFRVWDQKLLVQLIYYTYFLSPYLFIFLIL